MEFDVWAPRDWTSYLRVHYYCRSYLDLIEQPEPDVFKPLTKPPTEPDPTINLNLKEEYARSGLQIIAKLANVHFTRENPAYEGGTWHVESQLVSLALIYTFS